VVVVVVDDDSNRVVDDDDGLDGGGGLSASGLLHLRLCPTFFDAPTTKLLSPVVSHF